ncbi:acyl carrier protein [Azorhizophilus paspali]|uniref:acyl carrier protein n=1 Tax=Azorhizophilus paspali TaxID=69963 RepID=UPI00364131DA
MPNGILGEDTNLADFGFDSISLAEYAGLLSRHFSLKLTPELFFSHSTLAKVAVYLLAQHRQAVEAYYRSEVINATDQSPMPATGVASMSDASTIAIIGISGRFPVPAIPMNFGDCWSRVATW